MTLPIKTKKGGRLLHIAGTGDRRWSSKLNFPGTIFNVISRVLYLLPSWNDYLYVRILIR